MKKIFFSLLAIAALASCAKTEAVYTEGQSEIKIAPVTAMNTKAQAGVIDGIIYPSTEVFNVYAYWANQPAGSLFETEVTTYLNNIKFVNKGTYWGGDKTQYWPKNGSLRFAAYSPADKVSMTHNLAADTYELNGFTYPTEVGQMYDILVAPTSKSYTAQTAAKNVSVVFEHALSWITFKLESTEVAKNIFTVTDVIMNDVNNHGNMVADMKAGTKTWSTAMPQVVNVFNQGNGTAVTTTAAIFENAGSNGTQLLVLPQPTTTVTIKFTQNSVGDAPALENQTLTLPLTLAGDEPWEAGKHYTYTVKFDLDEILINPSVDEWEEVKVPTIDATPVVVATAEELQAAIEVGQSVRLEDDIQLVDPITVANSVQTRSVAAGAPVEVAIDLNGKNIIAPSTDAIIVDNGASLTINGDGKVWAATDDMSSANAIWVKYGNVTINGGDYYVGADNADRNDCIYVGAKAYVADAATKVSSVEINGGKFESKVYADNQYWVLNVKDEFYPKSNFVVKGGQFVNFDPSNNLSEAKNTNFLADGYGSYELEAGVWTVVALDKEVTVANINALTSVGQHGGVARLVSDLTLTAEELCLAEGKSLVLDLNQHTLTVAALDPICNEGTMTLKNGKVVANDNVDTRRCLYNYGTMLLEDMHFVQKYNMKGAALNNAGILTVNNCVVDAVYYSLWAESTSNTVVNNSKFTTTNTLGIDGSHAYAIRLNGNSTMTVNYAEVTGTHGAVCAYENSVATLNNGVYTLSTPSYTTDGMSSWVFYADDSAKVEYSEANCVLVKPETKTNGYYTTDGNGQIVKF